MSFAAVRKSQERYGQRIVVLAFVALWLALEAAAQTADSPNAIRLTLKQAVQLALRQSPELRIAELNVSHADAERKVARSELLPGASLGAGESVRRNNLRAALGIQPPFAAQHTGPYGVFGSGVSFQVPILDLPDIRNWQSAKDRVSESSWNQHTVTEQLVLDVVAQYLLCLRASADVQASRTRVDLAQALYQNASDKHAHGVGTALDALRADVELQNEKQRLTDAETSLSTSSFELARILDLPADQDITFADAVSFYDTPPLDLSRDISTALANRSELKALASKTAALEMQKRRASEQRLPRVSVGGQWVEVGITASQVIPTYQYTAQLRIPLFTGGRISAETAAADSELRIVAQEQRQVEARVTMEVKSAAVQLDAARKDVQAADLGVKLAGQALEQARDRFVAGVANNIEVITAQDDLARANDNQISALYRFNIARAALAHATGETEHMYAK
jgi:outer membrane protein